jgi:trans-L-3-hydroxyproline dehydratase
MSDTEPERYSRRRGLEWTPPETWIRIRTVDAHAEGEPLRVILDGFPDLHGTTILEQRRHASASFDSLRTALMWEPRGHSDMYGCIVTPPVTPGADFGVLFLHNEGFSTMCGHGIIALTKVMLETGAIPLRTPETIVGIDSPAGFIKATARVGTGGVESVRFLNVPSFAPALDQKVQVPGYGEIRYDIAFGGAFYAYVAVEQLGVACVPESVGELIQAGQAIKRAVAASRAIDHPSEPDLSFLYGTIFVGPPAEQDAHSCHVCVFAEGEVDRSPTGTGVAGRVAILSARGQLAPGESVIFESIIGSRFHGRIADETTCGPYEAVIPEVEGRAWITGRHEFWIDPADPLRNGFVLPR